MRLVSNSSLASLWKRKKSLQHTENNEDSPNGCYGVLYTANRTELYLTAVMVTALIDSIRSVTRPMIKDKKKRSLINVLIINSKLE